MGDKTHQRGISLWVILLVMAGLIYAAYQYNQGRTAQAQEMQQAQQQKTEVERQASERRELERRLAEEKQQSDALKASAKAMDDVVQRWSDGLQVASTTSRVELSGPVATLQSIRRDDEALTMPPCLDQAKAHLVSSMGSTFKGFLVFMGNEMGMGEQLASYDFEEADKELRAYKSRRAQFHLPT